MKHSEEYKEKGLSIYQGLADRYMAYGLSAAGGIHLAKELEEYEEEIREDQRKLCRDAWHDWFLNGYDSPSQSEDRILNAGKGEKEDEMRLFVLWLV